MKLSGNEHLHNKKTAIFTPVAPSNKLENNSPLQSTQSDDLSVKDTEFREALKTNPTPIAILDDERTMTHLNPAILAKTGYKEEDLAGRKFTEFLSLKSSYCFSTKIEKLETKPHKNIELSFICRDGNILPLNVTLFSHDNGEKKEPIIIAFEPSHLTQSEATINILSGLIPICATCKKIRNEQGVWEPVETYIEKQSEAAFSHGFCNPCGTKLYGNMFTPSTQNENPSSPPESTELQNNTPNTNQDPSSILEYYQTLISALTDIEKIESEQPNPSKTSNPEIKILQGLLPICSACKKIRNEQGVWEILEAYIMSHSNAEFSHGYCPDCVEKMLDEIEKLHPEK